TPAPSSAWRAWGPPGPPRTTTEHAASPDRRPGRLNTTARSRTFQGVNRIPRLVFGTLLALGSLFVLADGALLAVRLTWPDARIGPGGNGLASVKIAELGERIDSVRATLPSGRAVRVTLSNGSVVPDVKLRGGGRLHVQATVRRSKWLGWLLGR